MRRRTYLALLGMTTLAGCGRSGDGGDEPTAADGEAEVPAATAEPTHTTESAPANTQHEVGESFTVGSGDQTMQYTVTDVSTTDSVGGEYGAEADGQFVVIMMELINNANESFSISSDLYTLTDSQGREYDVDTVGVSYFDDGIIFEQVDPDVSITGTIVFDTPADQTDRVLEIQPASLFSAAETHTVRLNNE